MSGECQKCGEHCLKCKCEPFLERREDGADFLDYSGNDHFTNRFRVFTASLSRGCCICLCTGGETAVLTQDMVAELIPLLEHFVETGRLP